MVVLTSNSGYVTQYSQLKTPEDQKMQNFFLGSYSYYLASDLVGGAGL